MQFHPSQPGPVRLAYAVDLAYEVQTAGSDFIFSIQAARTRQQLVVKERLEVSQPVMLQSYEDPSTLTRLVRLRAQPGPLQVHYEALLELNHHRADPASLAEVPVHQLPWHVLPYLYPSRYCPSDVLHPFAMERFGTLWQGYGRIQAIRDWVLSEIRFQSNSSSGTTTACDTLRDKEGVCRDFAHLMIALCRAVNIPARFTTGIDYGADPALGPQDFHAYVEAFVGHRWYLFDPSGTAIPMGFIRLASGRDAADAAFASIFGSVQMRGLSLTIEAVPASDGVLRAPRHVNEGLSMDDALRTVNA